MKKEFPSKEDEGKSSLATDQSIQYIAEHSVIKMINTGSGGPNNQEITIQGLRFVRYLISQAETYSSGIIPNLKDEKCIKFFAQEFIRRSGTPSKALHLMYQIAC